MQRRSRFAIPLGELKVIFKIRGYSVYHQRFLNSSGPTYLTIQLTGRSTVIWWDGTFKIGSTRTSTTCPAPIVLLYIGMRFAKEAEKDNFFDSLFHPNFIFRPTEIKHECEFF